MAGVRAESSQTDLSEPFTPEPLDRPESEATPVVVQRSRTSLPPKNLTVKEPQIDLRPEGDVQEQQQNSTNQHVLGWRLWILTLALWISLFLSTLETTIVSTSLVSMTNALNGFILRDWVVTAYLLTYTGFLTIYAKSSDIFGRKTMLLLALAIFTLFSILCGVSNAIVELIVFRAFQGVGASGIYSMTMVIAPGLIPPEKYGKYMGIVSTVFIVASVLGPILGGVINERSTWRWVFWLNIPGGVVSFLLIAQFLPRSERSLNLDAKQLITSKFQWSSLSRIDGFGMFLMLASSILLIFALEEGGTHYPWNGSVVVSTLVVAVVLGILFAAWENFTERSSRRQEAVFPPSVLTNRLLAAMLINAFMVGFPFLAIVVNFPQKAQAVNNMSPVDAGLSLLPLLLTSPLATALSGFLTGSMKVPPFYLMMASSVFQLAGVGLTISLPNDITSIPAAQYGYEAIMGIGFGLGLTTLLTFARVVVSEEHLAVMMGALTQVRVLGGTISLAICAAILNNYSEPQLDAIVGPEGALAISDNLSAINNLTVSQQNTVREVFAKGYHLQNVFLTAMTALSLVSTCFLWEKTPRKAV